MSSFPQLHEYDVNPKTRFCLRRASVATVRPFIDERDMTPEEPGILKHRQRLERKRNETIP